MKKQIAFVIVCLSFVVSGLAQEKPAQNQTETVTITFKNNSLLPRKYTFITEVRGRGLMVAAELDRPGGPMVMKALERGYLINCTVDCVLRFLPPLNITQQEVDGLLTTLDAIFAEE